MSEDTPEKIKLKCPICEETHEYALKISKSYVLCQITSDMETSTKIVKVRRIFTCPTEDKEFQATLKIPQHFGEIINDVKVKK